jgi:hypothetical protein
MARNIGDIVFVLNGDLIVPMILLEEVTKKTINGTEVSYVLGSGGRRHETPARYANLLFDTLDAVRDELLTRSMTMIDKMVLAANDDVKLLIAERDAALLKPA